MSTDREQDGFTPEELDAELSEALPERALMSTVGLSGVDPAADAVDAVTDSVVTTATTAAGEPAPTQPAEATAGEVVPEAGEVVPEVGEAVPDVGEGVELPDVSDTLGDQSLLDVDVDLDAALDAAAPVQATVAANANVAAPVDAAVSANILSPDSVSVASAEQDALLQQTLEGEANAISDQQSEIDQAGPDATAEPDASTGAEAAAPAAAQPPATQDPAAPAAGEGDATAAPSPAEQVDEASGLLDLDLDLAADLDVAAPISAAVAANANVAAPIDAAVSANIGSPGATSVASADQDAAIIQSLDGEANAESEQASSIAQGEEADES